jgi:tetratricopeptide (TPR) repeat protein
MNKAQPRAVAMLSALLVTLPAVALAREGRLIGKVLDPQGKPIAGVTVTATSKDIAGFEKVLTTDSKGIFILDFDQINVNYNYRFEKAGYATLSIDQKWTLRETERNEFRMEPAQAGALTNEPPASTSSPAITAFNEGAAAFKARDHATATAKFEEALRHDPNLRQAWSALSLARLEQKQYQQAAEAAEKAVALGAATDQTILRARWEAYRNLGDAAKAQAAREALDKAGHLQAEAKRIHNEGVGLTKIGDDKEAFAKFQEAVEADPGFEQAWLALAVTGLKIGRAAEAAAAAKKLLEINPGHTEAVRIQYNAALQAGDEDVIADALVALAAVDKPTARDNLFRLGAKAFDADNAAKAKERFTKVLAIDPNHPRSNYYLGVLMVREGNKKAARAHLERFVQLAPADPDAETAKGLIAYLGK